MCDSHVQFDLLVTCFVTFNDLSGHSYIFHFFMETLYEIPFPGWLFHNSYMINDTLLFSGPTTQPPITSSPGIPVNSLCIKCIVTTAAYLRDSIVCRYKIFCVFSK